MRASYLLPNRGQSTLGAVFRGDGRAFGIVCCEQTDALREWRADEIADPRAIAAKWAMLIVSARDEILWPTPSQAVRATGPGRAARRL